MDSSLKSPVIRGLPESQRTGVASQLKRIKRAPLLASAALAISMAIFPTNAAAWRRDDDNHDRFRPGIHFFPMPVPPQMYYASPPVYFPPSQPYYAFPQVVYPPAPPHIVYPAPAQQGSLRPVFTPQSSSTPAVHAGSVIGKSRYGIPRPGILPNLVFGNRSKESKAHPARHMLRVQVPPKAMEHTQESGCAGYFCKITIPAGCESKIFKDKAGIPVEVEVTCTGSDGNKKKKFYQLSPSK